MNRVGLIRAICVCFCLVTAIGCSKEYHVAMDGNDENPGSASAPFKTISAASEMAQPGDIITVHEGVYRERIDPPRGGISDARRITYQAAQGEKVVIKGSEVIKGWEKVQNDTWKVSIPKSFFGEFNPYSDPIRGDWFNSGGRVHHTGAVYLNEHWLSETASLNEVLSPAGENPLWFTPSSNPGSLLNITWISLGNHDVRIAADSFTDQSGVRTAPCSEGGQCVGWIENGDWVKYTDFNFGQAATSVSIRAASPGDGGRIELRLGSVTGELLGTCLVEGTGDWQKWDTFTANIKPTSGKQSLCLVFRSHVIPDIDSDVTTIWAQFKDINPNEANVEINVRQSVFYPSATGINYLTVRGFTMMHAATNWAPPTAEQVGLIGTHWSKGWIIEDNDISYSVCTGVSLGKYGDEFDNTSADTADGYVKTIERGLENGWSKDNVGSHIVRNNHISHCEQAGIVGSLGSIFCTIAGNTIHDIHVRGLFTGAEMAGIKFHGAVDTVISHNYIYRTNRGIWLDWMAQGTRVTGNLLHDNYYDDLFVEVNHGPFLVDNNIMLSGTSMSVNSQGGAYVHNLFNGWIRTTVGEGRLTPHLKEHGTEVIGLAPNLSGDDRYYNNILVNGGLGDYDRTRLPVFMNGNVSLKGASPSKYETGSIVQSQNDPAIQLFEKDGSVFLSMNLDKAWSEKQSRKLVTTNLLGKAKTPDLRYVQPDGSPYCIDTDYFGKSRNTSNPFPGPFTKPETQEIRVKVWPLK